MSRRLSFIIFCGFLVVLLCGLGFWQIHRLGEKRLLLQAIESQRTSPARALRLEDFSQPPPEFTRILLSGEFGGQNFLLESRVDEGRVGFGLVRILYTDLADLGRAVAVDLGWVARDFALSRLGGESVSIDGIVRYGVRPNMFTPDNQPAKAIWHWVDLQAMGEIGNAPLPDFYVSTQHDIGKNIANNHLQYAFTWFGLAFVVVVMAVVKFLIIKD